jgi:NADH-quinone oxidoreductase subunit N
VFFILVYLFSNLAAFGVVSLVSAVSGKENLEDYRGFAKTNPLLAWVLAIALFSLAGIPPTAGFFGKYFLLISGAAQDNYILITIAALNMVIALYYYLKVIMAMFMQSNESPVAHIPVSLQPKIAMWICIGGIVVTGIFSGAYDYIYSLVQ